MTHLKRMAGNEQHGGRGGCSASKDQAEGVWVMRAPASKLEQDEIRSAGAVAQVCVFEAQGGGYPRDDRRGVGGGCARAESSRHAIAGGAGFCDVGSVRRRREGGATEGRWRR